MDEKWTCSVCAGDIETVILGCQSIHLCRGSPTFDLLTKLLGIREGDDAVLGTPRDAEVLRMCDTCSTVVQDLTDLQELLESTQNAIRQKVDWIRKRTEGSAKNSRTEKRSSYKEDDVGSSANSVPGGNISSVCLKEGAENFHMRMKSEPDDFEGEGYDDFAEPFDGRTFEIENLCVPDQLAFTPDPDRRHRKVVNIPSEGSTERKFEKERELLELHGLDYSLQPRVCLQRIEHSESSKIRRAPKENLQCSLHVARGTKCPVIVNQIDRQANNNSTNAGAIEIAQEESDRDEVSRLIDDDDDPDFLPSKLDGEKRRRPVSFRTTEWKKRNSLRQNLECASGSNIKEGRIRASQALAIIIKDGKMLIGSREIKEDDNNFFCCYRPCSFTMQKAETTEDSSKKMLEHLTVEHLGSGNYGCRRCELKFKNSVEYKRHCIFSHKEDQKRAKERQLKKLAPARSTCSACGKPLLISGIPRHEWSHKSDEEKREWLAGGKPNPIEANQRKKEKNQETLPHQCVTCGKGFAYHVSLKSHQERHKDKSERQKYICEECGQLFITEEGRRLHYRRAHDPNLNLGKWKICPICPDVKYLIRTHLESHMVKHHGVEKKFICEQCGHKSASKENLARHMFVHLKEGERPFQCEFCCMNYKHKNNLARHLAKSHPDKYVPGVPMIKRSEKPKPVILTCKQMYPCGSCDRAFELPSRMKKHQQVCKK